MKKVLIAYTTKTGSTKEVAEKIGGIITESNIEVDVKNIDAVASVKSYDCVIVGAPINGMRWKQEAVDFVGIHQSDLVGTPTAYFLLSYTALLGRKMWRHQIEKAFDPVNRLVSPVKTAIFGGRVEGELPAVVRFLFGMPNETPKDQRDWELIEGWAREISFDLKAAEAAEAAEARAAEGKTAEEAVDSEEEKAADEVEEAVKKVEE